MFNASHSPIDAHTGSDTIELTDADDTPQLKLNRGSFCRTSTQAAYPLRLGSQLSDFVFTG